MSEETTEIAELGQHADLFPQIRKHREYASSAWSERRTLFTHDLKNYSGDQWRDDVKQSRENSGRPALTFPELHIYVQKVNNQTRQNKPAIKINPVSGGARQETAKVYDGVIRHINYQSQGDVAREFAQEMAAAGSYGFYRIVTEFVEGSFDQEIYLERILDQQTVLPDPDCQKPDYSDANFYIIEKKMTWDAYRAAYPGASMTSWDPGNESLRQWQGTNAEHIIIAEYWYVVTEKRWFVALVDGKQGYADELGLKDEELPTMKKDGLLLKMREEPCRKVKQCVVNGVEVLSETDWLGKWIPIIPVLGKELIVDGQRKLISLIRPAIDGQTLVNGFGSGIAESIGLMNRVPYIGPKGSMSKNPAWQLANNKNPAFLEYDVIAGPGGQLLPPPQRNAFEPAVQSLTAAKLMASDSIKRAVGYVDAIPNPSQQDLSGVAVGRREAQSDLTNYHFIDNLTIAMWFEGRILLDLIPKIYDTPRVARILGEDGTVDTAAIAVALDGGEVGYVDGVAPDQHHRFDVGRYDVVVSPGKDYPTRRMEGFNEGLELARVMPIVAATSPDLILMNSDAPGHEEMAERARMGLPPQIQAAIAAKKQDPQQLAQQLAMATGQNQQLKVALTQALQELKGKIMENQTKLTIAREKNRTDIDVEVIKAHTDLTQQGMKDDHSAATSLMNFEQAAIENMLSMLHEAELAPTPVDPSQQGAAPQ